MAKSVRIRQPISSILKQAMQTKDEKKVEQTPKRTLEIWRLRSSIPTFYANFTVYTKYTHERKMFYWISQDQAKIFTRAWDERLLIIRIWILVRARQFYSPNYDRKKATILTTFKCFIHFEASAKFTSLS